MGPHCGLVSEKIVCLDVTLKAVVLKTPGQTNSGVLCLLQEPSPGRFVAALRGPMVAYFDKMSCNRCNEAPLCGFLPSVDSCRLLSGAIRRWVSAAGIQRIARFSIGSMALPLDWAGIAHSFVFVTVGAGRCFPDPLCHSMSAFYLVGRLGRFLLGRICFGAK